MIKSFADKETELIYNQKFSKRLPTTIQKVALRKLMMIDNAKCLEDLRVPPSNHLEQLVGDRKGQHSIRINDQWRVCFTEKDGHYYDVEIVDYHQEQNMSDSIETPTIGEILNEEFLIPLGISAYKLAQEIKVPTSRIQDILHNRRKITVDTSLRLAKFFGLSDGYFMSLQDDIDIRNAQIELAPQLEEIKTYAYA